MEYISKGNLFTILSKQKSKSFEAKTVASMIRDVISSVYFLHNMDPPIIHRDIKPENVLLHEDGKLKLADFGWSNYIDDNGVRSTYCGTPVYLAPEMIKEIGHDEHLDIWCIGILMFELLTGTIPFSGSNMNALSENIVKIKINWPKDINLDAKDLIKKILKQLTTNERKFLLSVKEGEPDWSLIPIPGIEKLPGIAWKGINIKKMEPKKKIEALEKLKKALDL
jgi:serine/threonine protein kinase